MFRFSFVVLYFILVNPIFCASVERTFFRLSPEEGLVPDVIEKISQDNDGHIWIYGADRIIRYDGYDFTYYDFYYKSEDKVGRSPTPRINYFIEDFYGMFAALGQNGALLYYDKKHDCFFEHKFKLPNGSLVNNIQGISNNSKEYLYMIADGIFGEVNSTGTFIPLFKSKIRLRNCEFSSLLNDSTIIVYNGIANMGARLNLVESSSKRMKFTKEIYFDCIFCDNENNIWVTSGNDGMVYKFDINSNLLSQVELINDDLGLNVNIISDAITDQNEEFWIASNAGIYIIDPKTNKLQNLINNQLQPGSLINNSVTAIFEDKEGGIWVGTSNGGLCYTHPQIVNFSHYKILGSSRSSQMVVNGFTEDNQGNVYIATTYNGIWMLNKRTNSLSKLGGFNDDINLDLLDIRCLSLINSQLWIGTFNEGVFQLNLSSNSIKQILTGIARKDCRGILQIDDNHLLIAFRRKIVKVNIETGQSNNVIFHDQNKKRQSVNPLDIFKSKDELILAGTIDKGIFIYDNKEQNFSTLNSYSETFNSLERNLTVEKIIEDDNNNIIAVTRTGGILKINPARSNYIWLQKSDSTNFEIAKSIVADQYGNLWKSSTNGLFYLNIENNSTIQFTKNDGLQSDLFQVRSSFRASDNRIFMGGVNGFNAFYPESVQLSENIKNVQLTSLHINNTEVFPGLKNSVLKALLNEQKKIKLNFNQRNFSFAFNCFDYLNSSKIKYRYKLDGYDTDWLYNETKNRKAVYRGVPSGKYTFIVAASIDDDWDNNMHKEINVVVLPPWWRSHWAIMAYFIFIISVFALAYKLIRARIELNKKIEIEKVKRIAEEESTKTKLKFFTNISHEFRTPLTLIAGPIEKLQKRKDYDDKSKMLIGIVHQNTQRLLKLINQLLDFRKLEKDYLPLQVSKLDIKDFIQNCSESFLDKAQKEGIAFEHTVDEGIPEVWFDSEKIETVIYNLLSNSFKFTQKGESIKLSVKSLGGGSISIIIEDTGNGMNPDQIKHIFERFYQAPDNSNSFSGGTGIGLSIVKEYIELHGGSIQVESQLGKGSKFIITLPTKKDSYQINQLLSNAKTVAIENLTFELSDEKKGKTIKSETNAETPTILIVEDNKEMRDFIQYSLADSFKIIEAEDGGSGLEMARKNTPDLIVSDVRMPGMDGIRMCQIIKSEIETSHIPLILLTAKSSVEDQIEGIDSGADLYVTKPFSTDVLIANIRQLIEQRKKLADRFKDDLTSEVIRISTNPIDQKFLKEIIEIIENDITNPDLNVKFFSEKVGFNHQQLYRKLKAITGQTVNEFIRTVRLKHAAKLLNNTQLTISEIIFESGFSNRSYFTKCFKTQFNVTPKEYREAN